MRSAKTTRGILTNTALLLLALTGPVAFSNAQGVGFCFGDPGSGTPCPCGNDNDGSVPGSGCDNGAFSSGAHLTGNGLASVLDDTLVLTATSLEPNNAGLYFQGENATSGGNGHWFGDGLRCAGGGVVRLQVRFADSAGTSSTTIPIGATGGVSPGDTKYYQCWYRTSVNPPCGSGINDFNTSNGYQVTWTFGGQGNMMPVPAGTFDMGDHHGVGFWWERPVHTVYLDAFYMDVLEVSNQHYADYLNTAYAQGLVAVSFTGVVLQVGGSGLPLCDTTTFSADSRITWDGSTFGVVTGKEDHPMVQVSWHGACAYANGLSLAHGLTPCYDETTWDCDFTVDGYRLPTEAEWEYAARGGEHSPYYKYPWGDTIDGSKANFWNSGDPFEAGLWPLTAPVSYYDGNQTPPGVDMVNGYGLYDTAGNVSEWCWDWYDENYYASSPPSNPTGPTTSSSHRVTRGGSWRNAPTTLRSADRGKGYPTERFDALGFRLVARP